MGHPVLVLQHAGSEGLGTIEDALRASGHSFQYIKTFAGDLVPDSPGKAPGLVVMGGPMGVYEYDQYPFLRREMKLIESFLKEERPILGVCLGSQLLASTLGAEVKKGPQKEIGWFEVHLRDEVGNDPVWKDLLSKDQPKSFTAYHWHGDIFDLPKGAVSLASSDLTAQQAFRYQKNAYGFLFHMEVTREQIQNMLYEFDDEMRQAKLDGPAILNQSATNLPAMQKVGSVVFARWAGLLQA